MLLAYTIFKETLDSFDRELIGMGCEWSVLGKRPGETTPLTGIVFRGDTPVSKLASTDEVKRQEPPNRTCDPLYSQPLATGLQSALFELLKGFNVKSSTVLGPSSGELAAA